MVHQIDLEMLDLGVENRVLEDAVDVAADGDGETRLGDVTEGTPKGMMNDVIDAQDGETSNRHCGALNYVNAKSGKPPWFVLVLIHYGAPDRFVLDRIPPSGRQAPDE